MGNNIKFEDIICTADRDQGDISTLAAMSMDAGPAIAKLLRIEARWEDAKTQSIIDVPEPKSLTEARAKAGKK